MIIEKDVPIPEKGKSNAQSSFAQRKYPFDLMVKGDSVFYPGSSTLGPEYQAAKSTQRRSGGEFIGRNVDGGLRIWRTE